MEESHTQPTTETAFPRVRTVQAYILQLTSENDARVEQRGIGQLNTFFFFFFQKSENKGQRIDKWSEITR